jgi:hypothetical protein
MIISSIRRPPRSTSDSGVLASTYSPGVNAKKGRIRNPVCNHSAWFRLLRRICGDASAGRIITIIGDISIAGRVYLYREVTLKVFEAFRDRANGRTSIRGKDFYRRLRPAQVACREKCVQVTGSVEAEYRRGFVPVAGNQKRTRWCVAPGRVLWGTRSKLKRSI